MSSHAWESPVWCVTARGGTFKLHLNLLLLCPPGWVTLRANATRPQDIRLHIQHLLQTSIIAGLPFSPPSLVANYTSFNKAAYRPWISLWAGNRLQSSRPSEKPGSKEAPHGWAPSQEFTRAPVITLVLWTICWNQAVRLCRITKIKNKFASQFKYARPIALMNGGHRVTAACTNCTVLWVITL